MHVLRVNLNIILSVDEESVKTRQNGYSAIMNVRVAARYRRQSRSFSSKRQQTPLRQFELAKLNFGANVYWKLPQLKRVKIAGAANTNPPDEILFKVFTQNYKGPDKWALVTEPPITEPLSDTELAGLVDNPAMLRSQIHAPCHSQSVEHGVATTSQAVKRWRTEDTQLGAALQIVKARQLTQGRITHKSRKLLYNAE